LQVIAQSCLPEAAGLKAISELQVSHLIQGSILEAGDAPRVIVTLIDVPGCLQLWAREFDVLAGNSRNQLGTVAAILDAVGVNLALNAFRPRRFSIAA
jgi:TolB-like protein